MDIIHKYNKLLTTQEDKIYAQTILTVSEKYSTNPK